MKKAALALAVLVCLLPGCGGGGNNNNVVGPPPVVAPPPTTLANFSGTYTGTVFTNLGNGLPVFTSTGRITVTHTGPRLDFGALVLTNTALGLNVQFPLGNAAVNGGAFVGDGFTYQSQGCGTNTVHTDGIFAGNLMNLHVAITTEDTSCGAPELRGEYRR